METLTILDLSPVSLEVEPPNENGIVKRMDFGKNKKNKRNKKYFMGVLGALLLLVFGAGAYVVNNKRADLEVRFDEKGEILPPPRHWYENDKTQAFKILDYYAELEKRNDLLILRLYDENQSIIIETTPVNLTLVNEMNNPIEYLYVGEPHTDDYEGNVRIDEITLFSYDSIQQPFPQVGPHEPHW